jgi:endo-1,4-beta-xylanase
MLSRRRAISGTASLLAALAAGARGTIGAGAAANAAHRRGRIPYGSCVRPQLLHQDAAYSETIIKYCQQVTPEGDLNWTDVRPNRDQFKFDFVDEVLAFAEANGMTMRGNTLVWYAAMPDWTKQIGNAAEAERELTIHIERVVSRYRGRIKTWHVVNEPIDDPVKGKAAALRPSIWLQHLGDRYIDLAFRLAHQADPSAELLLNEYDIETVDENAQLRRQALLALARDLLARGVPLHGVGLQGHLTGHSRIDRDGLSQLVAEFRSLGLSVHITELDVADEDLPAQPSVRDAVVATRAFDFLEAIFAATRPAAILTWGITDRYSWIPMWHKRPDGMINRPLPFDENYRPKPLWFVVDYFCTLPA